MGGLHQECSTAEGLTESGSHVPQQGWAQPTRRAWSYRNPYLGTGMGPQMTVAFEEPASDASLCSHPIGKYKPDLSDERDKFFTSWLCFASLRWLFVNVRHKEGVFPVS